MAKVANTQTRILDVAEQAVLEKGFDATSIEEIAAAINISRSGFFYHYPDKNALARALLQRYLDNENKLFDDLFARAKELDDDPLHTLLIGLKMLAELLDDLPNGHPGCLVAAVCYQDRLFDPVVRDLNRDGILSWRHRFRSMFEDIIAIYPPRGAVDLDHLADMFAAVVEGGIILNRALKQPQAAGAQVMQYRNYIKLIFTTSM